MVDKRGRLWKARAVGQVPDPSVTIRIANLLAGAYHPKHSMCVTLFNLPRSPLGGSTVQHPSSSVKEQRSEVIDLQLQGGK